MGLLLSVATEIAWVFGQAMPFISNLQRQGKIFRTATFSKHHRIVGSLSSSLYSESVSIIFNSWVTISDNPIMKRGHNKQNVNITIKNKHDSVYAMQWEVSLKIIAMRVHVATISVLHPSQPYYDLRPENRLNSWVGTMMMTVGTLGFAGIVVSALRATSKSGTDVAAAAVRSQNS